MSTPRIDDTLLQRLLDGDLASAEQVELEQVLEQSDADRGRVRALERLGDFVNDVADEDAAQLSVADSATMLAAVLAGLDAPGATREAASGEAASDDAPLNHDQGAAGPKRPKLRLIAGEGLGTLPPRSEKVAFEPKLGPDALVRPEPEAAREVETDKGAKWPGLVAVVALAAAAALALALRPDAPPPAPVAEAVAPVTEPAPVDVEDEPEVIVASHLGTEVEEIDFGSNVGTVFQVPGERDVPVAVVWISDEEYVR